MDQYTCSRRSETCLQTGHTTHRRGTLGRLLLEGDRSRRHVATHCTNHKESLDHRPAREGGRKEEGEGGRGEGGEGGGRKGSEGEEEEMESKDMICICVYTWQLQVENEHYS